ncbi:alpha/beta fold hydrolase [Mucilaginibacter myungsuensis]|uniref:Alpha/beta fold hydrolase n=2 Tax=Mucilaginibacter myungsuensis TaxID=649104 RepID=A0A929PX82_9SPHI|nr:alpha/beta fold hydrolase [Mucilaginibacter myungsuensis]
MKRYTPKIEPCDCRFKIDSSFVKILPDYLKTTYSEPFPKIDSSFKTRCGYLIVPENRNKRNAKIVKLPFIVVESKNPNKKKDPVLFTAGGPGNSSLSWALNITKDELINKRDFIAFEQRGTRYAIPNLRVLDLDVAIKESYRKNLNKDSMLIVGITKYKKTLEQKGIDLSGYNSDETVSDIHDLLTVLKIDSVNLLGGSYSGALMTAVLQKDPSRIRSLVLDSPLPMFAAIDEDEPANFNAALQELFRRVGRDSADQQRYGNMYQRFLTYFNGITSKTFYLSYLEKGTTDSLKIAYTKNELLMEVLDALSDQNKRKDLAAIVNQMIAGNHAPYVKHYLDELFRRNSAPDGMRIAVSCGDQSAYHSKEVVQDLYKAYPYLTNFRIHDVPQIMCDCWKVPPTKPSTKLPYYSLKPALLGDGALDPNCSPLYLSRLKHYMPNAQTFLFTQKGHGVGGKYWKEMMLKFLDDPYRKISSPSAEVVKY